jgi:mycothiol maleylpyruvate isomerase-like protein
VAADAPYVERNRRSLERLAALVARASDDDLRKRTNEYWTVAGVLLHIAYWDERSQWLVRKIERGGPFTASDVEPDDPSWINDVSRTFLHAIPPREAAELALRVAEETDRLVAAMDPAKAWPTDPKSLVNPVRAAHREEHLEEIEAFLDGRHRPVRDRDGAG